MPIIFGLIGLIIALPVFLKMTATDNPSLGCMAVFGLTGFIFLMILLAVIQIA